MKSFTMLSRLILFFILSVIIVYSLPAQVTDTIHVEAGWNLLSIPLAVPNAVKTSLFPTATSDAFIYEGFYTAKDTLEPGYGFWLKFDSPEIIQIIGNEIQGTTIEVRPGWNMIGSITSPIIVDSIRSNPPGIIASDFFYYDGSYKTSDTIKPGLGYWIKVDSPGGVLILSSSGTTCPSTIEYGGKIYNTILISEQCWLKENLDVGVRINGSQDASDNGTIEKYCYNDSIENCNIFGGLYQWNEGMQYTTIPGTKGICPAGWHIPTQAEFQILRDAVGGDANALKAIGQGIPPDGAGTNTSGFSALLGGYRIYAGNFYDMSFNEVFWSSTEYDEIYAYYMNLYYDNNFISLNHLYKWLGFSVRCLKY